MEYYLAIKKNAFESVLMRWMKLEPVIQSEVSYKVQHQYSVLFFPGKMPWTEEHGGLQSMGLQRAGQD